eukprot:12117324-Heterocapsa_arctica.AAC.1
MEFTNTFAFPASNILVMVICFDPFNTACGCVQLWRVRTQAPVRTSARYCHLQREAGHLSRKELSRASP